MHTCIHVCVCVCGICTHMCVNVQSYLAEGRCHPQILQTKGNRVSEKAPSGEDRATVSQLT